MQRDELIAFCNDNLSTRLFSTKYQEGNALKTEILKKRVSRIKESISWDLPPIGQDIHNIYSIDDDTLYFKKPGKEYTNKNENDMTPMFSSDESVLEFKHLWSKLILLGINDIELYRAYSTLLYRLAFLYDHKLKNGVCRYEPEWGIDKIITELGQYIDEFLHPLDSRSFLMYFDLIGWNEDIKYHTMRSIKDKRAIFRDNKKRYHSCSLNDENELVIEAMDDPNKHPHEKEIPSFDFRTGCINTITSAINVSFSFYETFKEIRENESLIEGDIIRFLKISQNLSRSGTCGLSNMDATKIMMPYIC